MRKPSGFLQVFSILFCLSILLTILSIFGTLNDLESLIEIISSPLRNAVVKVVYASINGRPSPMQQLQLQNNLLNEELASANELKRDNQALMDQFLTTSPSSRDLLPSQIVGFSGFIPGVSPINAFIIDKGSTDNIKVGNPVVYKNNLIGIVIRSSSRISVVEPITSNNISFTGQTDKSQALGIVRGDQDTQIVFGNVVLSDTLIRGDVVLTKGDMDSKGNGIPPDLIVGKIVSVNKQPSELFQTAQLQSLVDLTKLSYVFVLISQ